MPKNLVTLEGSEKKGIHLINLRNLISQKQTIYKMICEIAHISTMLILRLRSIELQNPEVCDATGDAMKY
jgi:hypothetical protein